MMGARKVRVICCTHELMKSKNLTFGGEGFVEAEVEGAQEEKRGKVTEEGERHWII